MRNNEYRKAYSYLKLCNINDTCDLTSQEHYKAITINNERITRLRGNINYLLSLIVEYGYLYDGLIGTENWYNFQVQLFHFDSDTNNLVLEPVLRKALSKNLISPITYSVTMDRHSYSTTGTQIYWTSPFDTNNPHFSVSEKEKIILLRESIGIYGFTFEFIKNKNGKWVVMNTY